MNVKTKKDNKTRRPRKWKLTELGRALVFKSPWASTCKCRWGVHMKLKMFVMVKANNPRQDKTEENLINSHLKRMQNII